MVFAFVPAFRNLAGLLRTNPVGTIETLGAEIAVGSAAIGVGVTTIKSTAYTVAFGQKNAAQLLRS